jgi:hypothetical protein
MSLNELVGKTCVINYWVNQIAGNNHWMTDFPLCDFDADWIFNMAAIEGHTFARDPMKNIIELFGNGLIE